MSVVTVDDIELKVRRSPRRRTLQVTIDRAGELILFAPPDCEPHLMEEFVRAKRFWIYRKLEEKSMLRPASPIKEYVSGEGFPYLGRSYRLLFVDDQSASVKLEEGRFKMLRAAGSDGRHHMIAWYTAHAEPWLEHRVQRFASRVGAVPRGVTVRDLGYRWGSCSKIGSLKFHWKTVLLPPPVVEYVVVHELVHILEPHHGAAFWPRVERALPDFIMRRQWLAENGHRITAL